jgi:hypothetical protein
VWMQTQNNIINTIWSFFNGLGPDLGYVDVIVVGFLKQFVSFILSILIFYILVLYINILSNKYL